MRNKKVCTNNYAVVGVIEAILIISLIAIIISLTQLVYIPQLMETKEAEHMDVVANQFSDLKFATDLHLAMKTDIPISTPITLGSRELPYFITARALGYLNIVSDKCVITITKNASESYVYSLGIIKYDAQNAYFTDQSYNLECGAVILSQPNGNTIIVNPAFSTTINGNTININFSVINITDYAEKKSIGGYDTCFIRTNYSTSSSSAILNVTSINVSTDYTNAWHEVFNTSLDASSVIITCSDGCVEVTPKPGYIIDLSLDLTKIYAQVSPGWIGHI